MVNPSGVRAEASRRLREWWTPVWAWQQRWHQHHFTEGMGLANPSNCSSRSQTRMLLEPPCSIHTVYKHTCVYMWSILFVNVCHGFLSFLRPGVDFKFYQMSYPLKWLIFLIWLINKYDKAQYIKKNWNILTFLE